MWKRCCYWSNMSKGVWEFRVGDFSLDGAPWSGRPVEVDSDQIEMLIENNQHYTTWEIANILRISKAINLLVKMRNVFFILCKKTKWTFWPTQYFFESWLHFLQIYTQKWDCCIIWVVLFLIFWGNSKLFSTVVVSIYISTKSAPSFPFLHILTEIFITCLFDNNYSNKYEVLSHCSFNLL